MTFRTHETNPQTRRWRSWLALGMGMAGVLVTLVSLFNFARWPVADMGGIIARALILALTTTQVVPLGGLVVAIVYRRKQSGALAALYWVWLALALACLVLGLLGASAFFRSGAL